MRTSLLLVLLVTGCPKGSGGENGSNGAAGPTGPVGPTGPAGPAGPGGVGATVDGGTPFTCKPLSTFCDGNALYTCTRSGRDASGFDCSTVASGWTCAANCPTRPAGSPGGACCVSPAQNQPPECVYAVTAPDALSGDSNNNAPDARCLAPSACSSDRDFQVYFEKSLHVCPRAGYSFNLSLRRGMFTVGSAITLPNAAVNLYYSDFSPAGVTCANDTGWTGTVTVVSETPNWKATVDATCTAHPTLHFAGTFNGTVNP